MTRENKKQTRRAFGEYLVYLTEARTHELCDATGGYVTLPEIEKMVRTEIKQGKIISIDPAY